MYPEALIKLHSPKNSHHDKVKPANKVSSKFDKHLYANFEKTSDEKRGTQKNIKGLNKKTSDEKRGIPENVKGLKKRPLMKKEAAQKYKGA
jgi:hypothetical protein